MSEAHNDISSASQHGKRVLITGATGMIGSLVLQHCLESTEVSFIVSLLRRPSGLSHDKLKEVIVEDFLNLDETASYFNDIEIAYYCMGVYTGAVNRESFRMVTVDYPNALAEVLIKTSPQLRFCLLSGAGADRKERSPVIFAKDKGAIENILSGMGFKAFHTFHPGYIYPVTPRKEPNFSYRLWRWLYPVIKYMGSSASVTSTTLALAIFKVGLMGYPSEIVENRDIVAMK